VQHWYADYSRAQTELYRGDAADAWARIRDAWPALERSFLLRSAAIRIPALYIHAGTALALAAFDPGASKELLRLAEHDAQRLAGERAGFPDALALLVRAAVARRRGDAPGAVRMVSDAEQRLRANDTLLFANVALRRRGELVGGADGSDLVASADAWLAKKGIRRPDRATEMLAPGFGSN
jgi:ATP/maltotriose-dependent transcriptional regulator MalT